MCFSSSIPRPPGIFPSLCGVLDASPLVCGLDPGIAASHTGTPAPREGSVLQAWGPYYDDGSASVWFEAMVLKQFRADLGTGGPKVGCVSMVSAAEPRGRVHASAEEAGGWIASVGAQAL